MIGKIGPKKAKQLGAEVDAILQRFHAGQIDLTPAEAKQVTAFNANWKRGLGMYDEARIRINQTKANRSPDGYFAIQARRDLGKEMDALWHSFPDLGARGVPVGEH